MRPFLETSLNINLRYNNARNSLNKGLRLFEGVSKRMADAADKVAEGKPSNLTPEEALKYAQAAIVIRRFAEIEEHLFADMEKRVESILWPEEEDCG